MNRTDVAKLLTVASGFDRRQVDPMTVEAWHAVIGEHDYADAHKALIDHFKDPETRNKYLSVGLLLDRLDLILRRRRMDVEADIRAAKARGIIPQDWPRREPLTPEAAYKLAAARERDREEAARLTNREVTGG